MTKDKQNPLKLEEIWDLWKECLSSNDINSIQNQILMMIWDQGILKLIIKGRQQSRKKTNKESNINGALHSFIDRNYFSSQIAAIRKIVDDRYSIYGEKGVYSLASIIKDISKHREELTRLRYFELINVPHDISYMKEVEAQFFREQINTKGAFFVPREKSVDPTLDAHLRFDRVSYKKSDNRTLEDTISDKYINSLMSYLKKTEKIQIYVNKHIAHASIPESREVVGFDDITITLNNLWEINIILYQVFESLSNLLTGSTYMPLLLETPDFYEHWNKPLFVNGNSSEIKCLFNDFRKETDSWNADLPFYTETP